MTRQMKQYLIYKVLEGKCASGGVQVPCQFVTLSLLLIFIFIFGLGSIFFFFVLVKKKVLVLVNEHLSNR